MGALLIEHVNQIRRKRGPMFVSRLMLRLKFDPRRRDLPDSEENVRALVEACRDLGYDLLQEIGR
jgi:hypothetical protein